MMQPRNTAGSRNHQPWHLRLLISRHLSPERIFILSFAGIILLGGLVLWLPFSATSKPLSAVDALLRGYPQPPEIRSRDEGGEIRIALIASKTGPLEAYRFLPERETDRQRQIRVRYDGAGLAVREIALRDLEGLESIYFEKNWPAFLTGAIYRADEDGGSEPACS